MQEKRTNVTKVFFEKLLKFGLSPILFGIALAIGLVAVNYVVAVKAPVYDVTKNKTNTLSRETMKLLSEINFDVTIKAFYATPNMRNIRLILNKYVEHSDHIKVEYIDPLRNPVTAEDYDVQYPRTIIFEAGTRKTRINPPTIRGERHDERDISIALYRLMSDDSKTIYFSEGHGELSISNTRFNGLSILKEHLEEQNYIVNTVNLLETGNIPDDCDVLIVAGPHIPFNENEELMLKRYLDGEKSIILMVDPNENLKLDRLLGTYGIMFGNDYIYETSRKLTTDQGGPIFPLCEPMEKTDITDPLENETFMFPFVRTVTGYIQPEGYKHINIVGSSADSWAETDMESAKTLQTGQKPVRDENERKGPLTVLLGNERTFMLPDSIATRDNHEYQVRSAFIGNSRFISNQIVGGFPSNLSLFLNTVNWITRNEKIIEVTPHQNMFTPVELKQSDRRMLNWLTLVIIPASILIIGIMVWQRRR